MEKYLKALSFTQQLYIPMLAWKTEFYKNTLPWLAVYVSALKTWHTVLNHKQLYSEINP